MKELIISVIPYFGIILIWVVIAKISGAFNYRKIADEHLKELKEINANLEKINKRMNN